MSNPDQPSLDRRLSVAPMMDWTDRHDRSFLRCLTRRTLLYTEMVVTGAILFGDRARFLDFDAGEHPLALQLGGSDPDDLARCAALAEEWGYDEVNLNVGCPSDRVSAGRFGACLMAEPNLVASCVRAMRGGTSIPITVKHRIGIDDLDSYDDLRRFIETVAQGGVDTFIIHARKAWLQGLSPKQNREIPPLRHDVVHRVKADYPDLEVILNGGLQSVPDALEHLGKVDGAMIGRAAYENPYILAEADRLLGDAEADVPSRREVVERYLPYIERRLGEGVPLNRMTRHILGLYQSVPGARAWRRHLSMHAHLPGAGVDTIREALELVEAHSTTDERSSAA